MKNVIAEGTDIGPWSIENIDKAKPIFTIITKNDNQYIANDLDTVMQLWRNSKDLSEVINVGKSG